MKALVFGATGFVGAQIARRLIRLGYEVDIFSRGEKPLTYPGVHTFYKGDRHSAADLRVLSPNRYEAVIDTSGYTAEDVLLAARALRRDKLVRYVFCSSGAVYLPSNQVLTETDPVGANPNWGAYGSDKLEAERALLALHERERFPVTVFRPSYIYGEGNNLYREAFLFDRFSQNRAVPVPDSRNRTQFVHIDDVAACFARCLSLPGTNGECYNLTHPERIGWRQLAETARGAAGSRAPVVPVPASVCAQARLYFPFHDVPYALSVDKLRAHGLPVPAIGLEAGLARSYRWYLQKRPAFHPGCMTRVDEVVSACMPASE